MCAAMKLVRSTLLVLLSMTIPQPSSCCCCAGTCPPIGCSACGDNDCPAGQSLVKCPTFNTAGSSCDAFTGCNCEAGLKCSVPTPPPTPPTPPPTPSPTAAPTPPPPTPSPTTPSPTAVPSLAPTLHPTIKGETGYPTPVPAASSPPASSPFSDYKIVGTIIGGVAILLVIAFLIHRSQAKEKTNLPTLTELMQPLNSVGDVEMGEIFHHKLSLADSILSTKFQSDSKFLEFARVQETIFGVKEAVGLSDSKLFGQGIQDGVKSIEDEFQQNGTPEDRKWLRYVLHEEARCRGPCPKDDGSENIDIGNHGKRLADFVAHQSSQSAKLSEAHVLALRLYTTPCFKIINDPLRRRCNPHPFKWTVYFISDAILKLRAVTANTLTMDRPEFLWRGMKDVQVPAEFERGGGTELACLSTTRSESVARKFASMKAQQSENRNKSAVLLKLRIIDALSIGASIAFLSAYPKEEEYLYPPLTFLRPTSQTQTTTSINGTSIQVLTVEPMLPTA